MPLLAEGFSVPGGSSSAIGDVEEPLSSRARSTTAGPSQAAKAKSAANGSAYLDIIVSFVEPASGRMLSKMSKKVNYLWFRRVAAS
jgi:hypothetical protein